LFHTLKEDEQSPCSDGTFGGERYFTCPAGRGFFTLLEHCRQDSRFAPNTPNNDASFHAEKGYTSFYLRKLTLHVNVTLKISS